MRQFSFTFSLFLNSRFDTLMWADLSKARNSSRGRNPRDFMYEITRSMAVISRSIKRKRNNLNSIEI